MSSSAYILDPAHTDSARIRSERDKARKLRKTPWWKALLGRGTCHYCGESFAPAELTMDHVVPLARGGQTQRSNVVPSCRPCNQGKDLDTPVDSILRQLTEERLSKQLETEEYEEYEEY